MALQAYHVYRRRSGPLSVWYYLRLVPNPSQLLVVLSVFSSILPSHEWEVRELRKIFCQRLLTSDETARLTELRRVVEVCPLLYGHAIPQTPFAMPPYGFIHGYPVSHAISEQPSHQQRNRYR